MKITLLLSLFTLGAFANPVLDSYFTSDIAQKACSFSVEDDGNRAYMSLNFIHADDSYAYYVYRNSGGNFVDSINMKTRSRGQSYKFDRSVVGMKSVNDELFIMTLEYLYIYKLGTKDLVEKIRILPEQYNFDKYKHAYGFEVVKNKVFIAAGEYGILSYNRDNNQYSDFLKIALPQSNKQQRSYYTDIKGDENKLYFAVDNITYSSSQDRRAFEGIVIYDLNQKKVHKVKSVNYLKEAYHLPTLTMSGSEIVISNLHLNFVHDLKKIEKSKYLSPQKRLWIYPKGELIGKAYINGGSLYGCFRNIETGHLNTDGTDF